MTDSGFTIRDVPVPDFVHKAFEFYFFFMEPADATEEEKELACVEYHKNIKTVEDWIQIKNFRRLIPITLEEMENEYSTWFIETVVGD